MKPKLPVKTYLNEFRKKVPLQNSFVKLEFRDVKDDGLCYGPYLDKRTKRKYFLIVINKNLLRAVKIDTLMHEYAHVVVKDRGYDFETELKEHGKVWGKCYSEVYCAFLKVLAEH